MENCPGGVSLQDGICPEFKCIGPSSCGNRGNCSSYKASCDCDEGFSGFDCSVNLEGEKLMNFMKLFSCSYSRKTKVDQAIEQMVII